jgi:hypothetical protein
MVALRARCWWFALRRTVARLFTVKTTVTTDGGWCTCPAALLPLAFINWHLSAAASTPAFMIYTHYVGWRHMRVGATAGNADKRGLASARRALPPLPAVTTPSRVTALQHT